jgi:hypothetical protein
MAVGGFTAAEECADPAWVGMAAGVATPLAVLAGLLRGDAGGGGSSSSSCMLPGALHRVSAIRAASGQVVGLTFKVGRWVASWA